MKGRFCTILRPTPSWWRSSRGRGRLRGRSMRRSGAKTPKRGSSFGPDRKPHAYEIADASARPQLVARALNALRAAKDYAAA